MVLGRDLRHTISKLAPEAVSKVAGTGVALHAKPSVAAQCTVRVNHGDLTALLYLQGYSRPEFAA